MTPSMRRPDAQGEDCRERTMCVCLEKTELLCVHAWCVLPGNRQTGTNVGGGKEE